MLKLTPLSGALGTEVHGLDLNRALSAEVVSALRQALNDHLVLLFKAQNLEAAEQIAFTEYFGKVEPHPLRTRRSVEGYPGVLILENQPGKPGARNDYWHSDISHAERPPLATLLHARIVPPGKGDTMFCNMYRAWDELSDGLKRMLQDARAWHSAEATAKRNNLEHNDGNKIASVPPPRLHPVVRINPDTGRKALFVNPHFVTHLEDMTKTESKPLLDLLYATATAPENVYRHHWHEGDVLIWDNRSTMHYAVRDYTPDDRRLMHRTTASASMTA